ncbi:MAG: sulfatase [Clostridiales bacterium]|nr:sulfatase [Clostridiales bacterium]
MRILMLDLDTLRPDHLGCYGYSKNTSPTIDSIARSSMRFDEYYCSDAPCLPSRAALFSGRFGIHNGISNHGGTAADMRLLGRERGMRDDRMEHSIFNIFRQAGMHTVSISTFAERHSSFWFNAGFHEMINVGKGGGETAGEVIPHALDWVQRHSKEDQWFMHLHLWDAHAPYLTPKDYINQFVNDPVSDWIDEDVFRRHRQKAGQHSLNELGGFSENSRFSHFPKHLNNAATMEELKQVLDGYDCGIHYMDSQIGRLIRLFKELEIYDDMAIIITSDHGEDLGELGIYSEHGVCDYCTTHIPLLIKWPGLSPGIDSRLRYNIDLAPTLCDLLGVKPYPWWDGQSFAPALAKNGLSISPKPYEKAKKYIYASPTSADDGHEYLVMTQSAHVCQRGVRFDDYYYIRTYHSGYHLFPKEMLFNIKDDPHEQHNLANDYPELCAKACRYLTDWQEEMMLTSEDDRDPLWTTLLEGGPLHGRCDTQAYYERLLKTGRIEGAKEFKRRFGNEFGKKPQGFRMTP